MIAKLQDQLDVAINALTQLSTDEFLDPSVNAAFATEALEKIKQAGAPIAERESQLAAVTAERDELRALGPLIDDHLRGARRDSRWQVLRDAIQAFKMKHDIRIGEPWVSRK